MKLILFSDRIYAPEIKTQLIDLIGKTQPTIGYISSCPDPSRQYYEQIKQYYALMEAKVTPYVDLESGFERDRIDRVFQADAIHLSGGNTYQFYYWIIERGLKQRLLDYANSGKVIIGVSAGAIIMTPDISYAEFCGDLRSIAEGIVMILAYESLQVWVWWIFVLYPALKMFQFRKILLLNRDKIIVELFLQAILIIFLSTVRKLKYVVNQIFWLTVKWRTAYKN